MDVRAQLSAQEADKASLAKDKEGVTAEVQELKRRLGMVNMELAEVKQSVLEKEDEVQHLKQEKVSLARELSEWRRECHSMTTSKNKTERDLDLTASELQIERKKITEVRKQ